jgi:hypothetical protein
LEELGLLGEEALWDVEAGGKVGLFFVDNDCDFFGEIGQFRETKTGVSMAPGCDIRTANAYLRGGAIFANKRSCCSI